MHKIVLMTMLCLCALHCSAQQANISSHQNQNDYYNSLGLSTEAEFDQFNGYRPDGPGFKARSACNLNKIVFGWHPYWVGSAYNNYDWDLLSDLSYFSYEVDAATGYPITTHGWETANVITVAQANGIRVNLCVTLFSGHSTFFGSPTAQQNLIDSLIALVQLRNANGVNIDFESVPSIYKNDLTTFMVNLSTQMHSAIPNSQVSTVLYAVDWNGVFDIPALSPHVDLFIIMGYDYYWSGSSEAGPNDPLYSFPTSGYTYSLSRSITYYLNEGLPQEKLVLGLPNYGREWTTVDNNIPSNTTNSGQSRTYKYVQDNSNGNYSNRQWHSASQTPYYVFNDGTDWRQCFAMDEESFAERLDLILERNIAGMGLWALGYDDGYLGLWNSMRDKLTDCYAQPCTGDLHDLGGPERNYYDREDWVYTIAPVGATSLSLSFSSFDVESNYDYLHIYDGADTTAPLIGTYTGTNSPGTVNATAGALTIHFTSDGATTNPGWTASWNCGLPANTYNSTIVMDNNYTGYLNCGLPYHEFYDSGTDTSDYANNENYTQTFCNLDTSKAIRISFRPNPTANEQIHLNSSTDGNDYLYIYNGNSTSDNLIGVYTGTTSAAPQPGTFISSESCLTVKMESNSSNPDAGWSARLYCTNPPTDNGMVEVGGSEGNKAFSDLGGSSNDYGNDENYTITYCPHSSAGAEVIWADFGQNVGIESNWDYLYVFDGENTDARLICAYTGDVANSNALGIIKATTENVSGCLTFQFFSDGATTASGWDATVTTGIARHAYGADDCANATAITNENETYAGSTALATGQPGEADPSLDISIAALPECSGSNTITRLENTVWYSFTTVNTFQNPGQVVVRLDNISCQSISGVGSGVQFVLYEIATCQNGSGWGNPIYCADKLVNGDSVEISTLLQPATTYYIMIDGFTGQHCNFDIRLDNNSADPIILSNSAIPNPISDKDDLPIWVYPNPTQSKLTFELKAAPIGDYQLWIYDTRGRAIQQVYGISQGGRWRKTIPTAQLPAGLYLYRLQMGERIQSGRFTKN